MENKNIIIKKQHTCESLAKDGLWNTERCHKEDHLSKIELCSGLEEYEWLNDETAILCCEAYWYFYGLRHDPYAREPQCTDYLFKLQTGGNL